MYSYQILIIAAGEEQFLQYQKENIARFFIKQNNQIKSIENMEKRKDQKSEV